MKKLFTLLTALMFISGAFLPRQAGAQSPEKMSYQAVIRNSSNQLVTSHVVGMKISILQGTVTGSAVYVEAQTPTTNINGLVSIEIGGGTVISGAFSTIDWTDGPYFIKTEADPAGGTNYTITGTSQLLSVPYALHSKTTETADYNTLENKPDFSGWDVNESDDFSGNYGDLTNKPTLFDGAWNSLTGKPTTISGFGITDAVTITGNQTITGLKTFSNDLLVNGLTVGRGKNAVRSNTAIGNGALFSNTTGYFNTAIGDAALYYNTTGLSNTAIGAGALCSNTTGLSNIAIGDGALYYNTTGLSNTAIGNNALASNNLGNGNTALGKGALGKLLRDHNTAIGFWAGWENRYGERNIFLGAYAGYWETGSDKLYIDNRPRTDLSQTRTNALIYGVFNADPANQVLTINGNVGIGTTSPSAKLEINGGYGDRLAFYRYADNTIIVQTLLDDVPLGSYNTYGGDDQNQLILQPLVGNVGIGHLTPGHKLTVNGETWCSAGVWIGSDIRWKKNIKDLNNSLSGILELNAVIYELKTDEFPEMGFKTGTQIGLIAQDVEKVFPYLVTTDNDGYKAVAYDKLSAVLVEALKEQQLQIEGQQKEIDELRALINNLLTNQTGQLNK